MIAVWLQKMGCQLSADSLFSVFL